MIEFLNYKFNDKIHIGIYYIDDGAVAEAAALFVSRHCWKF